MNNEKIRNLFLKQSYEDAWTDYEKSLLKRYFIKWDYVILTASNDAQAQAYQMQIDSRLNGGFLPKATHFAVLADPDGKRVGSGGATFNVIKYVRNHSGDVSCFEKNRILVIHSGGDSKRVPQYSACGKLFSPVPRQLPDGRQSTLFDEFMVGMSGVPSRIKNGMLVLSGDVLLLFNPLQIDVQAKGAAAISIKEHVETGKNHGVFLNDGAGNVDKFLHKLSVQELSDVGAVNEQENVDLDTGAIIFDKNVLSQLLGLISSDGNIDDLKFNEFVNEDARLSFYGDFLYPLAVSATLDQYLKEKPEGDFCDELISCRNKLWKALNDYSMQLICLSPAEFIHFGTTSELLSLLTEDIYNYEFLGWKKQNSSVSSGGEFACVNSYVSDNANVEDDSYVEDSCIVNQCKVGHKCVVSNVTLSDTTVPDYMCIHGIQTIDGKHVARGYGITDNPKMVLGKGATMFGVDLSKLVDECGIDSSQLWEFEPFDLWNAKLFPVCDSVDEAVSWSVWLNHLMVDGVQNNDFEKLKIYLAKERLSLCSSFNMADTKSVISWQTSLDDQIKISFFINALNGKADVETAKNIFGKNGINDIQKKLLLKKSTELEFKTKIRILYYLSKMTNGEESEELERACFQSISHDIRQKPLNQSIMDSRIFQKNETEVRLPVRVNFGGGWSDTPPYCNENGGTVLNASVYLKGEAPIVVKIKKIGIQGIVLASEDSGAKKEFLDIRELQDCSDPFDPFALHKAALICCGLVREDDTDMERIIKEIGSGFYLSTNVLNIPRGSGLGTSSILAGACVKAIYQMIGISLPEQELYTAVMCMEQLMTTGGGWQDQVGGVVPGIKFITTDPGIEQSISVQQVSVKDSVMEELNQRFALIYTGQRRLARNLLRDVVGKYIGSNQQSVDALYKIQRVSALMRFELEKGDVNAFATLLNEHWELSKQIDKGCTNTCIDQIFMSCDDLLDGKMICGAGGGGFLQVILKKHVSKEMLSERLCSVYQDSGVDVWDCEIR